MTNPTSPFDTELHRRTLLAARDARNGVRARAWRAHGRAQVERRLRTTLADLATAEGALARLGEAPRDGEAPSAASRWAAALMPGVVTGAGAAYAQASGTSMALAFVATGGASAILAAGFDEWLRQASGVAVGTEPRPASFRLAYAAAAMAAAATGALAHVVASSGGLLAPASQQALVLLASLAMLATLLLQTMRYGALARRRYQVQAHAAQRRALVELAEALEAQADRLRGEEGAAIVAAADAVGATLLERPRGLEDAAPRPPGPPFAQA